MSHGDGGLTLLDACQPSRASPLRRQWLHVSRLARYAAPLDPLPTISAFLQHGVLPNPAADAIGWRKRRRRMVLVKTGCNPILHQLRWERLPHRFWAVLEESAAAALQAGARGISDTVLQCLSAHDLFLDTRPDILFGLNQEIDVFVRDYRSTAMVRAMLDLPVDIIGRGWEHLAMPGCKARFRPATDGVRFGSSVCQSAIPSQHDAKFCKRNARAGLERDCRQMLCRNERERGHGRSLR